MTADVDRSVEFTPEPGPRWALGVVVAGVISVAVTVALAPITAVVSVPGVVLLGIGTKRANGETVDLGGAILFLAVVVTAVWSGQEFLAAIAAVGAIVAWDLARASVDVGFLVGRDASTDRLLGVHVATTLGAGAAAGAVGAVIYNTAGVVLAFGAVFLLIVTATVFVVALSR